MNIIILGAGENGFFLAEELSNENHNVCVLEEDPLVAQEAREKLDARMLEGNGASVTMLEEASVADCHVFFGMCSDDHTNLVAASLAKALGANFAIARVHASVQHEQWLFDYRSRFGVDYLFSIEHLAAVELAKFLRNPDALIVEEMAGGKIELQQLAIREGSKAARAEIRSLGLPPRIRIGSVEHSGRNRVPQATDHLHPGDVVTLFGNPRHLQEILPIFQEESARGEGARRVVIFGGGDVGEALARMLENGPFRTRIFEKDSRRCEQLARVLKNATLIQADATSARILQEEQIGEADFFVATTSHDEDNVMTCLQARDLGVERCLTLVHRADYADVIVRAGAHLGIVGAISPRLATRRDLARFVSDEPLHTLVNLKDGVEVVEFTIAGASGLVGKTVGGVSWPEGSGLVSLTRGSSTIVPAASDELRAGDTLIALVSQSALRPLRKLLG